MKDLHSDQDTYQKKRSDTVKLIEALVSSASTLPILPNASQRPLNRSMRATSGLYCPSFACSGIRIRSTPRNRVVTTCAAIFSSEPGAELEPQRKADFRMISRSA